jgi:hypothetical protein
MLHQLARKAQQRAKQRNILGFITNDCHPIDCCWHTFLYTRTLQDKKLDIGPQVPHDTGPL